MWTGNISIRTNASWTDVNWDEVKKWPEVEKIWTTTGGWDWLIQLKPAQTQDADTAQKVVWNLRKNPWIASTETWWSKQC